jgi:predicted RNA binding protein YcfA (HicA-like mRNA interferase family)
MGQSLPSISGDELIRILEKDGWIAGRRTTHGIMMTKKFPDRIRVTIVPTKDKAMPEGTLAAILGSKQTCIGREGLLNLLDMQKK